MCQGRETVRAVGRWGPVDGEEKIGSEPGDVGGRVFHSAFAITQVRLPSTLRSSA